jgi:hypothetical protein
VANPGGNRIYQQMSLCVIFKEYAKIKEFHQNLHFLFFSVLHVTNYGMFGQPLKSDPSFLFHCFLSTWLLPRTYTKYSVVLSPRANYTD